MLSVLGMLLGLLGATTLTGSPANALVGPYVTKHADWGGCTIYIGTVVQADASAVGGTDVWCPSARNRISVTVTLWRYSGSSWRRVGGTGTRVTTGNRSAAAQTPFPVYKPGCASWDITATIRVDGYKTAVDFVTWGYTSAAYPRYYPTRPNVNCG